MNVIKLRQWHALTWLFRAEMQQRFPTPPRDDSLAFAFTEAAEAVDAELRQNPRYKRNNEKEHSIERELAQSAMMLLTAVPETFQDWQSVDTYPFLAMWSVRNIAVRVAQCMAVPSDYAYILGTVAAISTIVQLDVLLPAELDRMRAKYGTDDNAGGALRDIYPQRREGLVLADYVEGSGVE